MAHRFGRYLVLVLVAIVAMLAVAGAVGDQLLFRKAEESSKPANVRRVDKVYRLGFIDWFIARRMTGSAKPLIVVLGDSQPYGFGLPEGEIVSARIQEARPAYRVFNLAVQAGTVTDVRAIINRIAKNGVRPNYLVISFKFNDFSGDEDERLGPLAVPPAIYFMNLQRLVSFGVFDESLRFAGVPDNQFFVYQDTRKEDYTLDEVRLTRYLAALREMIAEARRVSDHVILFSTAVVTQSMATHYGIDVGEYRRIVQVTLEACRAAGVVCLDLTEAFPGTLFFDLVHLNRGGHRALAQRLVEHIAVRP